MNEEGGGGGECFVADGTGIRARVGVKTLVLGEDFLRRKGFAARFALRVSGGDRVWGNLEGFEAGVRADVPDCLLSLGKRFVFSIAIFPVTDV